MLGLRPRNQNGGRYDEVHSPEFLMSGNVLRWHTARTLRQRRVIAGFFVRIEFALRMRKQVGAIAAQDEPQQKFGVHLRRGHLRDGKARNSRGQSLLELHEPISRWKE